MQYKFGICGPFDFNEMSTGGQSIKTREFYFALSDCCSKETIMVLESTEYKKNPLRFVYNFYKLMKNCENVIVFPAQNGIRVFAPLCKIIKKITNTCTFYGVIGGWLPNLLTTNPKLKRSLLDFDCILVETNVMKTSLINNGLQNVEKLENFKRMQPVSESDIKGVSHPVKLCYFSRVTKQKGIEDAVKIVNMINKTKIRCTLDIYGPVADGYDLEFDILKKDFSSGIRYMGKANPSDSVSILSEYDLQVFPTHYRTEGIPGSILDGYFAGVPVVAAKWDSFSDLVEDGVTGRGYTMGDLDDFYKTLMELILDEKNIMQMKKSCLKEANKYLPQNVIHKFLRIVGK